MTTDTHLLPEEFLVAVLHKVGPTVKIVDDFRLAKIFNDAAEEHRGPFRQFAWNSQYRYSKRLSESLQALDDGGSITRDNPANDYFVVTEHTVGPFGESLFSQLPEEQRKTIEVIAAQIQQTFGD